MSSTGAKKLIILFYPEVFPDPNRGVSQEKLVFILERIVDTGESILVGWDKIYNEQ